jgi:hypothetical protein
MVDDIVMCKSDLFWKYTLAAVKAKVYIDSYESTLDRIANLYIGGPVDPAAKQLNGWRAERMAIAIRLALVKSDYPLADLEKEATEAGIADYVVKELGFNRKELRYLPHQARMREIEFLGMIGDINAIGVLITKMARDVDIKPTALQAINAISARDNLAGTPADTTSIRDWEAWQKRLSASRKR